MHSTTIRCVACAREVVFTQAAEGDSVAPNLLRRAWRYCVIRNDWRCSRCRVECWCTGCSEAAPNLT